MEQVRNSIKKVIELIKSPGTGFLPGNLAFFFVLSLIPIAALLSTVASKLSIPLEQIHSQIGITVPGGVGEFISSIINGQSFTFNIGIFLLSAFILASNGMNSIITASNEIYKIKPKSYLSRRIKAILMTIILVEILLFLFMIPVFGDKIFTFLRNNINNQHSVNFFYNVYKLIKYPLSIVIIFFNIKLIYVIAPDKEIGSITTTKGSIFTTIMWIIVSEIYSIYLDKFTKFDLFYGSVSNILILLLWVYVLSYIFVLGLIINAGTYNNKHDTKNT